VTTLGSVVFGLGTWQSWHWSWPWPWHLRPWPFYLLAKTCEAKAGSKLFTVSFKTALSSSPVERVFSQSGFIVRPNRARMTNLTLETLVLLRCNNDVWLTLWQFLPCNALRCTVFVIVILSVRLSVRHTRGLCPHGSTYDHDFFTIW